MEGLPTAPSSVRSRDAHQQTGTSRVVGTNGVRLSALLLLYCGGTLGAAGGPTCSSVPAEVHREQRAEGAEGLQTPPGGRRGLTGLLTVSKGRQIRRRAATLVSIHRNCHVVTARRCARCCCIQFQSQR